MSVQQFKRQARLVVSPGPFQGNNPSAFVPAGGDSLDLSELHFTFHTSQQDVESPNNCTIRVYNLSDATVRKIRGEYSQVTLQAGYEGGTGVIFSGTIKQFKIGRQDATTKYLDILAADGDIPYNFSVVNKTLAAASTAEQRIAAAVGAMVPNGATAGYLMPATGGVLPRGKVLFGMARAVLRQEARNIGATWNISNGQVNVVPLDGYLPGEAVDLTSATGMVGLPEQTNEGIKVKCLLNPRIVVGGLVRIDNKSINQIVQANPNAAPIPYNQYAGLQLLATVANDGLYRVYVAEHDGDTRGTSWYTNLVCLAVDPSSRKVQAP